MLYTVLRVELKLFLYLVAVTSFHNVGGRKERHDTMRNVWP